MNSKNLIDQLLKAGTGMLQGGSNGAGKKTSGMQMKDVLVGAGGGAAATAALGMLLGNRRHKKMGGKVLTYGGLAALGVLAYKAYGNWQQKQQQGSVARHYEPETVDRLPEPQVEQHSQAILRALIGAAKSDGHIDTRERELIDGEIAKLTHDPHLQRWFDQEMNKPLDPLEIASYATTPEIAAEMFLASVLVVDEESFMERSYLQELAKQLRLDPALEQELRAQVAQVQKEGV